MAGSSEGMELLYEYTLREQLRQQQLKTQQLEAQLLAQSQQVSTLQSQVQAMARSQPAISQQAATIINSPRHVTSVVNINVFGGENIGHIGRPEVKALLDKTLATSQPPLQSAIHALIKAAAMIYSDPQHPENLTCYIPNKKHDDVLVHGDAGWQIQSCQLVLPPMAMKSCNLLFDNQPFEDADRYGDLMRALQDNEEAYAEGKQMRTILLSNKALLDKARQGGALGVA